MCLVQFLGRTTAELGGQMRTWGTTVIVASSMLVVLVTGCAKSASSNGVPGTTITVTFIGGTPLAVATQSGTGAFTVTTPGNQVTFTLLAGITKYAIAYVCPPLSVMGTLNSEFVIQATTQDATSFTASCFGPVSSGTATGGTVSSSFAGTAKIQIRGGQGLGADISGASGAFPAGTQMPVGSNDVATIAVDGSGNVQGVKMFRAQTVPGAINGGAGIVLLPPGDAVTTQNLNVTNVPANFVNPPEASVTFHTANGTRFLVSKTSVSSTNPQPYGAVPTAATLSTDFYAYESNTADAATNQAVGITATTTSGGGSFSLALPTPWTFAGPAAAKFPTFTFIYSGFTGQPAVADQASISWTPTATTTNEITVLATANFLGSATTITVPDLTSLSGFLTPAATGTTINWVADIFGGTVPEFTFFPNPPANATLQFVQNRSSFMQP